jgi:hypothetical protein
MVIGALQVIGWIAIVGAVIQALMFLPNLTAGLGETATGFQWASVFGSAFGGLLFLGFAALLSTASDISANSYEALQEVKSAFVWIKEWDSMEKSNRPAICYRCKLAILPGHIVGSNPPRHTNCESPYDKPEPEKPPLASVHQ